MKPVRPSDRGPAVEDIQRRLLALGYEIGPTGVDGVFLGKTAEAVRSFQLAHHLDEDGVVGDETWAALVDAGFTLGDRMLYLRVPYFHGRDVRVLQQALSVLGFACGLIDGIFGTFTEHAVREFQANAGLPADGIVGPETVGTLSNLRHVWEGKDAYAHSAARTTAVRTAEVLARAPIAVACDDEPGSRVAERLVNLAHASADGALLALVDDASPPAPGTVVLRIGQGGAGPAVPGRPLVLMDDEEGLAARLITALATLPAGCVEIALGIPEGAADGEQEQQRTAVRLLDAICAAFD